MTTAATDDIGQTNTSATDTADPVHADTCIDGRASRERRNTFGLTENDGHEIGGQDILYIV